jgi:CheY-like chemotaxis protein
MRSRKMNAVKPFEVLIVEDNLGDALIISELLEDLGHPVHITIAQNGQRALNLLGGESGRSRDPAPDFVILDLNLPLVNGFEILAFLKSKPALSSIPVAIMTGSLNKDDEEKARRMGVTEYYIKPSLESEFEDTRGWLRKHISSLDGPGRKESIHHAKHAMLNVNVRRTRLPARAAHGRDLPPNVSCPGFGEWKFQFTG